MTNIKDIALAAGVTVTTISRVLNNHPYVSSEKRVSVQALIKQLNYTPNASAISLKNKKKRYCCHWVYTDVEEFSLLSVNRPIIVSLVMVVFCDGFVKKNISGKFPEMEWKINS